MHGKSPQSCLTLCDAMDSNLPGFSVHKDSPGRNTGVGCHALLQRIYPNPGIEPRTPALQADSLPSEPPGKKYGRRNRLEEKLQEVVLNSWAHV